MLSKKLKNTSESKLSRTLNTLDKDKPLERTGFVKKTQNPKFKYGLI